MNDQLKRAARAVMEARVRYGWTFGKRKRVMAIDIKMAEAALSAAVADDRQDHDAPPPHRI